MSWDKRSSIRPRSRVLTARHLGNADAAARTARSTSSAVACGVEASVSPVAGSINANADTRAVQCKKQVRVKRAAAHRHYSFKRARMRNRRAYRPMMKNVRLFLFVSLMATPLFSQLTIGASFSGVPNGSDLNVAPVRTDVDLTGPA